RYPEAIPHLLHAIELEKSAQKLTSYRHAAGWSLYAEKRYPEAREQLTKALQLDPKLQGAMDGLEMVKKAEQEGTRR
ncbi:MAG: tetratricopeptide repeat protein, partial [Chloroflexota bacterium]